MGARDPALGILELESIARGVFVADAVVKRARSQLFVSRPVSGGKHLIMMCGPVAEIEESMGVGRELSEGLLVDQLEVALLSEQLWPLLERPVVATGWQDEVSAESVAIVETATVCAAVAGADCAIKTAPVDLRDMRLAVGINGKAFFTMTGVLCDVQAAAAAAQEVIGPRLLHLEVIAQPAQELRGRLLL